VLNGIANVPALVCVHHQFPLISNLLANDPSSSNEALSMQRSECHADDFISRTECRPEDPPQPSS
jgi:hypothetical protein